MTQENKDRLHKAADEYAKRFSPWLYSCIMEAFIDGAEWQKEQLEKNRLEHCDNITEEQYNLESNFVTEHIKKNNRMPTFLDAIEYGMQSGRKETVDKACEWLKENLLNYWSQINANNTDDFIKNFKKAMENRK